MQSEVTTAYCTFHNITKDVIAQEDICMQCQTSWAMDVLFGKCVP